MLCSEAVEFLFRGGAFLLQVALVAHQQDRYHLLTNSAHLRVNIFLPLYSAFQRAWSSHIVYNLE